MIIIKKEKDEQILLVEDNTFGFTIAKSCEFHSPIKLPWGSGRLRRLRYVCIISQLGK